MAENDDVPPSHAAYATNLLETIDALGTMHSLTVPDVIRISILVIGGIAGHSHNGNPEMEEFFDAVRGTFEDRFKAALMQSKASVRGVNGHA